MTASETEHRSPRRMLLLIAYDGTDYSGFALQSNAPTVSGVLRAALLQIDPNVGPITGSSRTDSGVHARNQPVSFTTTQPIKPRGWVLALNQRLPPAISVTYAAEVDIDFDPRKAPLYKRYRYRVFNSEVEDPFISRKAWRVGQQLDLELMRREAMALLGEHDFRAFRSADDPRTDTVRRLTKLEIERKKADPRQIDMVVEGNRFMYNMVRIIAGTLIDIGRMKLPLGSMRAALDSGDRQKLGMTAPARGLMLEHVELPDWGRAGWPERTLRPDGA